MCIERKGEINFRPLDRAFKHFTTAFLLRIIFHSSLLRAPGNLDYSKSETDYKKIPPITASERNDAFNLLIYLAQMNLRNVDRLVPARVVVKLINYPLTFDHMILGGRIKNFPKYFASNPNIPIIPSGSLAQLIIRKYHMKYHRQVDTVVTHVRNEVWIIGARKIASKIDRKCITCIKARKKLVSSHYNRSNLETLGIIVLQSLYMYLLVKC